MYRSANSSENKINSWGDLFTLLRPKQWIKNSFVLAALIFSGKLSELDAVVAVSLAVLFFCVASSAVYIVNDYVDIEDDRRHPIKSKTRPLASGRVTKWQAFALLSGLYFTLALGFVWKPAVMGVILVYLALNTAYSLALKHQPIIDIFSIAVGFVLRIWAGAVALMVPASSWILVTSFCLALYLAAIKRRQELKQNNSGGRQVLQHYTVELVERYAEMSATGALLFYSLFAMTAHPELVLTIPVVLYGLFRYWYVVEKQAGGESPTDVLLSDKPLLLSVLVWALCCVCLLQR